jgi:CheY-like chemotaxis protein
VLGRSKKSEIEAELVLNSGTSTILFIDDEQALCELGATLLETLGYRVFTFHSCKEAIDYFKAHHNSINLIITDYAIPEMNGPLVIEKLKQMDQNVPIIMVTGFTNMVNEEHRLKWACGAIMSKPYNIVGLSQMIAKHVNGL